MPEGQGPLVSGANAFDAQVSETEPGGIWPLLVAAAVEHGWRLIPQPVEHECLFFGRLAARPADLARAV